MRECNAKTFDGSYRGGGAEGGEVVSGVVSVGVAELFGGNMLLLLSSWTAVVFVLLLSVVVAVKVEDAKSSPDDYTNQGQSEQGTSP